MRELTAIRPPADLPTSLLPALRPTAARNRLPAVYGWLAKHADRDQVVPFLSWEGGPDAGFDDLVATCQLGLSDPAKTELATPCGGRYCCAAGWIAG